MHTSICKLNIQWQHPYTHIEEKDIKRLECHFQNIETLKSAKPVHWISEQEVNNKRRLPNKMNLFELNENSYEQLSIIICNINKLIV